MQPWFEKVYRHEFAFVWRSLRNLGAPERHLEDLTHEVFLVLHKHGQTPDAQTRGFLYLTARNLTRNLQRQERRVAGVPLESGDHPLAEDSPETALRAQEASLLMQRWLQEIHEDDRDAFIVLTLKNVEADAAADVLGCSKSTLYGRAQRAREHLERRWERWNRDQLVEASYVVR